MKYSTRDLPPLPSTFDHAHPKPERPASFGTVIAGLCVLCACFSWPALILSLEVVTK